MDTRRAGPRLESFGLLFVAASALGACAYAPPVYSTHAGAAGRLGPEQGEVRVASGYTGFPVVHGTVSGSVPLTDRIKLELGPDFGFAGGGNALPNDEPVAYTTGRLGLRFTSRANGALVGDLEVGGGMGFGGTDCPEEGRTPNCSVRTWERAAGGVYAGAGAAVWIEPEHALFLRTRVQVTGAHRAPVTLWASTVLGVDLGLGPLRVDLAAGGFFWGSSEIRGSFVVELGLTIPIGPESRGGRAPSEPRRTELPGPDERKR